MADNFLDDAPARIEQICQKFESALQRGESPSIDDFVLLGEPAERPTLREKLRRLDSAHRPRQPTAAESHTSPSTKTEVWPVEGDGAEVMDGAELRPPDVTEPTDKQLLAFDRYQVTGVLGKGGFGVVYRGFDPELRRDVAIKVPRPERLAARADAELFMAEARVLASLDHPGIVPVYDVGRTRDGCCYVVSKYVHGSDLATRIGQERMEHTRAAELVARVAEALHHAHQHGLVHRDIKPGNILLDDAGHPLVADFGLALTDDSYGRSPGVVGTPSYMSPEQARGEGHRVDARSDVYSLGVVLYELLTGRRPYRHSGLRDLIEEMSSGDIRPPRQLDHSIPKELERICLKALAKRAADRYTTAFDLAADLRHFRARRKGRSSLPLPPGEGWGEGGVRQRQSGHSDRGQSREMLSPHHGPIAEGEVTPLASPMPQPALAKIIPKGLRSFDAHDADFFLQLLPGPTDRDGLPESIRFWKTRIEPFDAVTTFSVGLLYGPSGCGKSSLVKAGLLPRLDPRVISVLLEATGENTESELLKGLRRRCPRLREAGLTGTISALRHGHGLEPGQKVLIVLDQFEQWLHAHSELQSSELVLALRQCDGVRVQCLAMVRDDFWMAASQFLRELEIPLIEGVNSAAAYLFDTRHARRILAMFGRALGCLPEEGELPAAGEQFLDSAVAGLAEDAKVVPVRLALFAEMVKSKPWTPATLRQLGGISGVGVAFLEETFSAPTAPPQHRVHQKAARTVLKALLPDAASDIKAERRSRRELLAASGYAQRPDDFAELLRVLDLELRLITPAEEDPETERKREGAAEGQREGEKESQSDGENEAERDADLIDNPKSKIQNSYQLTHDYLVPSLREWLTRKQRQTRRGRAELLLAERAAAYAGQPISRNLPTFLEWCRIAFFTRRAKRARHERRMLRAAARRHVTRGTFLGLLTVMLAAAGLMTRARLIERQAADRAGAYVEQLLSAETSKVPELLHEFERHRRLAGRSLERIAGDTTQGARARRHAALALARDRAQLPYLRQELLSSPPDELLLIRDRLLPYAEEMTLDLWSKAADDSASQSERFHAAAALAGFDPGSERWNAIANFLSEQLLSQHAFQFREWLGAFAPVGQKLVPSLVVLAGDESREPVLRTAAAHALIAFAVDSSNAAESSDATESAKADMLRPLMTAMVDSAPEQFEIYLSKLAEPVNRDRAVALLTQLLEAKEAAGVAELRGATGSIGGEWHDGQFERLFPDPPASAVNKIESAAGMVAEQFALCQTLLLDEFETIAEALRPAGYRPVRLRPYLDGDHTSVAAVWTRDGLDWRCAVDLAADELLERNGKLGAAGFVPVDVAGYLRSHAGEGAASVAKNAGLWRVRDQSGDERRVFISTVEPPDSEKLRLAEFSAETLHRWMDEEGNFQHSSVWRKTPGKWHTLWDNDEIHYVTELRRSPLQVDVSLIGAVLKKQPRASATEQLATAELQLALKPDDLARRLARARARFQAGDDLGALEDVAFVRKKELNSSAAYGLSAEVYAHQGRRDDALANVSLHDRFCGSPPHRMFIKAVVAARLGDYEGAEAAVEADLPQHEEDGEFLYQAACALSTTAGLAAEKDLRRAESLRRRAVFLVKQAVDRGYDKFDLIRTDADLDALRDLPEFQALSLSDHAERRYYAVFHVTADWVSTETHALTPSEQIEHARKLAAAGYRPAALTVAHIGGNTSPASTEAGSSAVSSTSDRDNGELLSAAVWQRPIEVEAERRLRERQSRAVAAMARLGATDPLQTMLVHSARPGLRTKIVHRLAPLGVAADQLVQLAFASSTQPVWPDGSDVGDGASASQPVEEVLFSQDSFRRALILALGEYDSRQLPSDRRAAIVPKLLEVYRDDPDAGIHGAAAWLLRRWGEHEQLAKLDALLSSRDPQPERRWFVNGQAQAFAVIPGPVEFQMGSPFSEPGRQSDEAQHRRQIRRWFAISATEVTNAQYARFGHPQWGNLAADAPVVALTWYKAAEYCNWLSRQEGLAADQWCYEPNATGAYAAGMKPAANYLERSGYRLPTEAEWEFACRAGATTAYFFGAEPRWLGSYGWCYGASLSDAASGGGASSAEVFLTGKLKPNDFGLFDLYGNVVEWCDDRYVTFSGGTAPVSDRGNTLSISDQTERALRGGSVSSIPAACRSATRSRYLPTLSYGELGFRLARTVRDLAPPRAEP